MTRLHTVIVSCLALLAVAGAHALEVTHVYHEPAVLESADGEVAIHFRLSEPARAAVDIYDGRNIRIRRLGPEAALEAGDHVFRWAADDFAGRPVPPEAYVYAIEAVSEADGTSVRWDLADETGGDRAEVAALAWDAAGQSVRYQLAEAARVRIRAGLANGGPLLRTVVDWVARAPGGHGEPWDGRDVSGLIDLARHSELALVGDAFSLPRNAVLITRAPARVALIEDVPEPVVERPVSAQRPRRMFDYASQPLETRRDYPLRLEVAGEPERTDDGAAIVRGPVPIRLFVDDADQAAVLAERAEAVFYVDGRLLFENQVSFLPVTWTWDPAGTQGVHYITANLRGYDGHFGIQTLKVVVEPARPTP